MPVFKLMRFSRLPRLVTWTLGIFFGLATIAPLPYAIVLPGEAQNIFKGVITFKEIKNYPATGRIDLMSIRVTNPDTWIFGPELVYSWISGDRAVYPKTAIYPAGTTAEEESKQAKADMVGSQDNAIIAAVNYLQSHPEVMAPLDDSTSKDSMISKARADALDPKKITFKVSKTGGPSGGLIFSLGLIDLLTSEDLLKGRNIAGTGTIDVAGTIGPIGGVTEKIIGAKRAGASVLFISTQNCGELPAKVEGIEVIAVEKIDQAIDYLREPFSMGKTVGEELNSAGIRGCASVGA